MYCPTCATQHVEGSSFCRTCGANLTLVSQAMSGQLMKPEAEESCLPGRVRRRGKEPLTQSVTNIFMGIGFLIVAIALSRSIGAGWWFWMLLPAFGLLGSGIGQYVLLKSKEKQEAQMPRPIQTSFTDRQAHSPRRDLSAPRTGELMSPAPSVTEGTTRHLGVEAPTRHLDVEQ